VLAAYRHQCSLCRLKHEELLDAAHIIPDADPEGEPVVSNGLALCRLHHSAFDNCVFRSKWRDGFGRSGGRVSEQAEGPFRGCGTAIPAHVAGP
jgi:hypothetical protein